MSAKIIGAVPVLTLLALLMAGAAGAQRLPPLGIQSMTGHDLFDFYCASCHGRDGRGGGPVAPALKTPPPDLTKLAASRGGRFPRATVTTLLTTGAPMLVVHGPVEMPVWGPNLQGAGHLSDQGADAH